MNTSCSQQYPQGILSVLPSDQAKITFFCIVPEELRRQFLQVTDSDRPYMLILFSPADWFDDLTPWSVTFLPVSAQGHGPALLTWITRKVLPQVRAGELSDLPFLFCGYSLGGLFALYASLQIPDCFGCASISGSLWYPDLLSWIRQQTIPKSFPVYTFRWGAEKPPIVRAT